jgi:transposase-like protein
MKTRTTKRRSRRFEFEERSMDEFHASRRKDLPEPATLLEEVKASGWSATARRYGVMDATIRKWLRKAGLV